MASVRIGIAQVGSVHIQLEKSLEKLETILDQASKKGVQLLALGETWLSGYPAWLDHCPDVARWDHEPMKQAYLSLHASSLSVTSKEFNQLLSLVKQYNMVLCIGINERVDRGPGNGTLYNSVLVIDERGQLQNHHRKLMPTYNEKLLYGMGDGYGLKAVETSFGRITTSICWEHWMPLTRQVLHDEGEHFHVALWPTVNEMHQVASRQYAFEGRCFVLAVGQMLQAKNFPASLPLPDHLRQNPEQWVLSGGSCLIGPNGNCLTTPLFNKEEIIVCEVDTDALIKERMTLDTTGHYQRRDIFSYAHQTNRQTDS